jgi:hypothetical protein
MLDIWDVFAYGMDTGEVERPFVGDEIHVDKASGYLLYLDIDLYITCMCFYLRVAS